MKIVWLSLVFCSVLLATPSHVLADQEIAPFPYVTAAEMGRYYFKLVPGEGRDESKGAVGTCYKVEAKGNDNILWATNDWYAFTVFLSVDGQYLVRLGNWPRGHAPSADHLAVAFYKKGELLKSYSTRDLIKDVAAVRPSVSHYTFYTGKPTFVSTYNGGSFTLTSVDNITYQFNIATGEIISQSKTENIVK